MTDHSPAFETWVADAKAIAIEREVERRGIVLRGRVEKEGPCPVCGGTNRFSINTKKQIWNCRGCAKGGDVIALVQHIDGCTFHEAVEYLTGRASDHEVKRDPEREARIAADNAKREREAAEYDERQRRKAAWLWSHRQELTEDCPAGLYLRRRGYRGEFPPTLGYLPPRDAHPPAMIAAFALVPEVEPGVLDQPRNVQQVHLTRLMPDGHKAALEPVKIIIGPGQGLPIVLAPPTDLLGLAITEGVEDGLSVYQATGLGVWVAGAAGRMPALAAAIPDYIECVTIFAHADKTGQDGALGLARVLEQRGVEMFVEGLAP
jgi:hypothetical protein